MRDLEENHLSQDVDASLRAALAPEPRVVERVVRSSLSAKIAGPRRGLRWAAALAAVVLVVGIVVQLAFTVSGEKSGPKSESGVFQMTNRGSVILVTAPSGKTWLLSSAAARPPRGQKLVILQGG